MDRPISDDQDDADTWPRVGINLNLTQALKFERERERERESATLGFKNEPAWTSE